MVRNVDLKHRLMRLFIIEKKKLSLRNVRIRVRCHFYILFLSSESFSNIFLSFQPIGLCGPKFIMGQLNFLSCPVIKLSRSVILIKNVFPLFCLVVFMLHDQANSPIKMPYIFNYHIDSDLWSQQSRNGHVKDSLKFR